MLYDSGDLPGALDIFERALADFFDGTRPKLEQRIDQLRSEIRDMSDNAPSPLPAQSQEEQEEQEEQDQDDLEYEPDGQYISEPGRSKDWVSELWNAMCLLRMAKLSA